MNHLYFPRGAIRETLSCVISHHLPQRHSLLSCLSKMSYFGHSCLLHRIGFLRLVLCAGIEPARRQILLMSATQIGRNIATLYLSTTPLANLRCANCFLRAQKMLRLLESNQLDADLPNALPNLRSNLIPPVFPGCLAKFRRI